MDKNIQNSKYVHFPKRTLIVKVEGLKCTPS